MGEGNFREDLFYRLNVVKLTIPPLRKRKEDIPLLIHYFIKQKKSSEKVLSEDAFAALRHYDFPGNVRELNHLIERGMLLSSGGRIEAADLLLPRQKAIVGQMKAVELCTLEKLEKEHIAHVLNQLSWNKTKTAEILGISVRNLYRKIEQYGLKES